MIRSDDFGGLGFSLNRGVELLVRAEDGETAEEILGYEATADDQPPVI